MIGGEQEGKLTPMMAQWQACKEVAKDSLLLFRMGDFYEAFHEDAVLIAREADLTLTKRQEIPMCGIPHYTSEAYIDKLVSKGYRVAVAEQTSDPKAAKGLVRREVIRIVTPGTLMTSTLLPDNANNFFAALTRVGSLFGLAAIDLSTGQFSVTEFEQEAELLNELWRLHPAELLTGHRFAEKHTALLAEMRSQANCLVTTHDDWHFDHQLAYNALKNHFNVHSLDGFGLKGMTAAVNAAGALISYLQDILCLPIQHIYEISPYSTARYMALDRTTQRNLELTEGLADGSRKNTLLAVLDHTTTPMGARLLRQWLKQPLLDIEQIHRRQGAIELLLENTALLTTLDQQLEQVRDLERLMMRVSTGYATPRDLVALRYSLAPISAIKSLLTPAGELLPLFAEQLDLIDPLPHVVERIAKALVDEPPLRTGDGNLFRTGYNAELDELRGMGCDSQAWLALYQANLRASTGIKTLRVSFTKMFGYYIEVSRGQADKMPDTFSRRQTLVNAERFISPELKEFENKVLHAEERIAAIESDLFAALRQEVSAFAQQVFTTAQAIARVDALHSLAIAAKKQGYIRPRIDATASIHIVDGRHPVIEAFQGRERFIPNDTLIDDNQHRLLIITGPNMAGKSTYIRQVALIAIMAQMGSFVPARSAHLGIIDKVFTRIGASDDLSRGQSTFMVEMTETANILHNATSRSLVILDEIGRGTSTYDGISIAWSVAEYLLNVDGKKAKTLFATHYWELTKLEEKNPGAVNYSIAVHEDNGAITFLRKIVRGSADKSYGIHVGQLAGLPQEVIMRAKEILRHLEEHASKETSFEPSQLPKRKAAAKKNSFSTELQLSFY